MGATNVFTTTLEDDSLTITSANNVQRLSVICREGTIDFAGSGTFQGIATQPVTFNVGQGVTITASATANPIDGVTITSSGAGNIAEIIISTS